MDARRLLRLSLATTTAMTLVLLAFISSAGNSVDSSVTEDSPPSGRSLTIAVTRLVGGWAAWPSFTEALEHVSQSTGVPIQVRFLAPGESAEDIFAEDSDVDAAFMSTYAFLLVREKKGDVSHLATPIIRGRTSERAVFVVHANSPYLSLQELRGARLALSPPGVGGSIPGNAYARWLLQQEGLGDAEEFFREVDETSSQDANLQLVLNGSADATTVSLSQLASWPQGSFRVLHYSERFAMPPFVVSPELSDAEAEWIIDALVSYTPDGDDAILGGFTRPRQEDYDFPYMLLRFARDRTAPMESAKQ
ncbi:MAG: PhnD/SsuA/transferrin family substrate-binding protein [Clostridiales bacterium]|nr:PhnD/SsuA/transferrin family substrate-binding protein [Clostridiales bacterium]